MFGLGFVVGVLSTVLFEIFIAIITAVTMDDDTKGDINK